MQQSIKFNPVHRDNPRISDSIIDSEDFHCLLIHYASFLDGVMCLCSNGGRGTRDIIIMSAKTPANMPIGPVPGKFK
jgi:hypothetical protein